MMDSDLLARLIREELDATVGRDVKGQHGLTGRAARATLFRLAERARESIAVNEGTAAAKPLADLVNEAFR